MAKERRTIAVDPSVWEEVQRDAEARRVSASWVTETALREFLDRKPGEKRGASGTAKPSSRLSKLAAG